MNQDEIDYLVSHVSFLSDMQPRYLNNLINYAKIMQRQNEMLNNELNDLNDENSMLKNQIKMIRCKLQDIFDD